MSSQAFKQFIKKAIFNKQGPPGLPPRPGLQWKPSTHRWIRPKDTGTTSQASQSAKIPDVKNIRERLRIRQLASQNLYEGKPDGFIDRPWEKDSGFWNRKTKIKEVKNPPKLPPTGAPGISFTTNGFSDWDETDTQWGDGRESVSPEVQQRLNEAVRTLPLKDKIEWGKGDSNYKVNGVAATLWNMLRDKGYIDTSYLDSPSGGSSVRWLADDQPTETHIALKKIAGHLMAHSRTKSNSPYFTNATNWDDEQSRYLDDPTAPINSYGGRDMKKNPDYIDSINGDLPDMDLYTWNKKKGYSTYRSRNRD